MRIHVTHRDEIGLLLNDMNLLGDVAEIGCAYGGFARTVLNQWKGKGYFMVDPWKPQDPAVYREKQPSAQDYEAWWIAVNKLASEDSRVELIRALSANSAPCFWDGQLDACYIDGAHDFEHAYQDMTLWWPKVKPGGIFAGHDYQNKTDDGWYCEVKKALDQFVQERGLCFNYTECGSFWIFK